jgi:hypothetical protein
VNAAVVTGRDIQDGIVFDADAATVTPFITGIDITKVANPTLLPAGGGPVTYSYEVTNTGNVPLANVTARVTDDRCPNVQPVTSEGFNVGDIDHNDLLTNVGDLFETGAFETWLFTCTTNLTVTTLNTVTVIGTPVQPTPDPPTTPQGLGSVVEAIEVIAPDVTDQAQALVTVDDGDIVPPTPSTMPTTTVPAVLPPTGGGGSDDTGTVAAVLVALGLTALVAARRRQGHQS